MLWILTIVNSCSSQKHMTSTSINNQSSTISKMDSLLHQISMDEDIEIAWNFDEGTVMYPKTDKLPGKPYIKPSAKSPPRKGTMHIKITKRAESIKSQTKTVTKSKQQQAKKDKKKEKKKKETKIVKNNVWYNALFIIIFVFIVKYVFEHKNNLKKVWNLLKKKLTLQHL